MHWTESDRLKALEAYRVLDTPQEKEFDNIASLAALICDAPVSLVNFVAESRQWFKATVGTDLKETARDVSFCQYALKQKDVLVVPDAMADVRFQENPLVLGQPHIRSYAGALLEASNGLPIGTVCVIDFKPREFTPRQVEGLKTLARQVMMQLEIRLALEERKRSESFMRGVLEAVPGVVEIVSLSGHVESMNQSGLRLLGYEDANSFHFSNWVDLWETGEAREAARVGLAEAIVGRPALFSGSRRACGGQLMPCRVSLTPILDPAGIIEGVLAISNEEGGTAF